MNVNRESHFLCKKNFIEQIAPLFKEYNTKS